MTFLVRSKDQKEQLGIEVILRNSRMIIVALDKNSPCAQFLKIRDVVVSFDNKQVKTQEQLKNAFQEWRAKKLDQFQVVVRRQQAAKEKSQEKRLGSVSSMAGTGKGVASPYTAKMDDIGLEESDFEFHGPSTLNYFDRLIKPPKSADYSAFCIEEDSGVQSGDPLFGLKAALGADDVAEIINCRSNAVLLDFDLNFEADEQNRKFGHENEKNCGKNPVIVKVLKKSAVISREIESKDCETHVKVEEKSAVGNVPDDSTSTEINAFFEISQQREQDVLRENALSNGTAILGSEDQENSSNQSRPDVKDDIDSDEGSSANEELAAASQVFPDGVVAKKISPKKTPANNLDKSEILTKSTSSCKKIETEKSEPKLSKISAGLKHVKIDEAINRLTIASDVPISKILKKPKARDQ